MRALNRGRLVRLVASVAIFAAGLGVGAGYMAYAATTGDTYHACVTSKGDIYRVRVNASYSCIGSDKSISWNQKGQPGPIGPTGPQGVQGEQGEPGEAGRDAGIELCTGCNFNFSEALQGQDLTGAYLSGSSFDIADLRHAILHAAILESTSLFATDMTDVDLSGASLYGANIEHTDFNGARMDGANLLSAFGTPINLTSDELNDTTCPDGTNSDDNGDSCDGHLLP